MISADPPSGYDSVASDYAREFQNELEHKPFDRKMLDWLIEKVDGLGAICDLGCGPGQVAAYLQERGSDALGIDLSPEMVRCASELHPAIRFQQGDMSALAGVADDSFGGIAAFYSVIHVPRADMGQALGEMRRVLRPGGVLLAAFHLGSETIHRDEWWSHPVSIDFIFYQRQEMREYLQAAGFQLEEAIERDPYPDIEYPSRRAYLFARK